MPFLHLFPTYEMHSLLALAYRCKCRAHLSLSATLAEQQDVQQSYCHGVSMSFNLGLRNCCMH